MNLRIRNSVLAGLLAIVPVAVSFAEAPAAPEPSIPFANRGGIKDWKADHEKGLWVQDVYNRWFYATLLAPCTGLNFAQTLGFETRPVGSFDRWSTVVVPRYGRCAVKSFAPSGPPPRKKSSQPRGD